MIVANKAKPNATIGRNDTDNIVYNPPNAPSERDKLAELVCFRLLQKHVLLTELRVS